MRFEDNLQFETSAKDPHLRLGILGCVQVLGLVLHFFIAHPVLWCFVLRRSRGRHTFLHPIYRSEMRATLTALPRHRRGVEESRNRFEEQQEMFRRLGFRRPLQRPATGGKRGSSEE